MGTSEAAMRIGSPEELLTRSTSTPTLGSASILLRMGIEPATVAVGHFGESMIADWERSLRYEMAIVYTWPDADRPQSLDVGSD